MLLRVKEFHLAFLLGHYLRDRIPTLDCHIETERPLSIVVSMEKPPFCGDNNDRASKCAIVVIKGCAFVVGSAKRQCQPFATTKRFFRKGGERMKVALREEAASGLLKRKASATGEEEAIEVKREKREADDISE